MLESTRDRQALARIAFFEAFDILRNYHDAEDVVAEAMVRFLAAPVVPKTPGAWVRAVAHNLARNQVEGDQRFRRVAHLLEEPDTFYEEDNRSAAIQVLGEVMALLPGRQKEAVMLYYFEQLDRAGVAKRMNISMETVKTHLERAVLALRAYFDEAGTRGEL